MIKRYYFLYWIYIKKSSCETIKVYSALEKQECETLYKTFKITLEDTTSVFITEVLKKYQIKDDIDSYKLSINSGIDLIQEIIFNFYT